MQKAYPTSTVPFQAVSDGSQSCRIRLFNPLAQHQPGRIRIHVLFTNPGDTAAALNTAIEMACELDSEIALIVTKIVPFPLALDDPPVPLDFASEQIRRLADSVTLARTELQGYIYFCRNPTETLLRELPARSLIVIGVRPRWPFGKSKRLARALRRSGHEVILANHE
jgi:hypothetical protein